MRKLLLLILSAGVSFAQLPQDTLRTRLHAPTTVKQKFLAEDPGAVEERRTEHSVHFRKPDGTRVAVISQHLHWRDPETGQLRVVEPALWTLDNGWRLEGGPVKTRILRSGTSATLEFYHQRDDKQWKSISFTLPAPAHEQGLSFSFVHQKLTWKLRLTDTGFDLTADVPARLGSQTYSFPQAARLLDLRVDPDTGDLTGDGFVLCRAVMVRADRNRTPCSAWTIKGGNISFTCDDSDFPAEAFPYVIDPTGSFYPAASEDDAWAQGYLYGAYGCPAWPGALTTSWSWGGPLAATNQTISSSAFYYTQCWKYSHQSYIRFDTSSIPSGSTLSSASVSVNAALVQDGNQDYYGGAGCSVQADWYASINWPLTSNEWSLWGSGNAVAPQDLTGKSAGWHTFPLANLTNIPTGAGAYAGLKWSVPCEPFIRANNNLYNEFTFYSFDNGPSTKPYLSITYSEPVVQYYLTTAADPPAGGAISPASGWYPSGTVVSVSATANSLYQFTGFSGDLSGTTNPQNLTMNGTKTVTANFKRYYLTTAASPPAGGTISPASGWYDHGTVVSVSATANPGYTFTGFSGDLTGTTNPQNLTMNAPKTVTANFNRPPQAVSVTPSSGSGLGPQAFQFLYSDPNGYTDLASLYGRFNATASHVAACSFRYDRASNYIYLYNDAGTGWAGSGPLGSQLTNSQCTLGAGSTTPSGNNLTLNLTVTFKTAFAGAKNTYMQAVDASAASSGWQTRGTWTVPTANQPPQAVSVTPSSGSGLGPQAFQFLYSDPDGYANLASLYGRFNATASDASACSFRYDRASNYIYLYNDAGTAWLGPYTLGSQVNNSQCTLGAGSTTPNVNNLTLNLTITFKTAFAGAKNTYMLALDAASASSGWQTRGTWTVPTPLTITTASPLPGGTWGVPYSAPALAASGGTPPYTWSVAAGLLPAALTLSSSGVLSGTPKRGGQTFGLAIQVRDSLGAVAPKDFTLAIGPTSAPIAGPSRLEVGLSYMPFNQYDTDTPASEKFPNSCQQGEKIRTCFKRVLAELRAQGVSGVRIFFGLCGQDSTPLANCGQPTSQVYYQGNSYPADRSWINRVKDFFEDVQVAEIQNITLTPVHITGLPYERPKAGLTAPGPNLCSDTPDPVYFYPAVPLGYKAFTAGPCPPDCPPVIYATTGRVRTSVRLTPTTSRLMAAIIARRRTRFSWGGRTSTTSLTPCWGRRRRWQPCNQIPRSGSQFSNSTSSRSWTS